MRRETRSSVFLLALGTLCSSCAKVVGVPLRIAGVVALVLAVSSSGPALAQLPTAPPDESSGRHRLHWNEAWPEVPVWEYPAIAALFAVAFLSPMVISGPDQARFRAQNPVDDGVRDLLVLSTRERRERADFVSDLLWHPTQHWNLLVDIGLVTLLLDLNPAVAWEMMMVTAEAMGIAAAITRLVLLTAGRERPIADDCDLDPTYDRSCESKKRYSSFYSGHAAMAMTGAGLVCVHHEHFPLYGGGFADAAACGVALASATAVGVLRLMADRHYLSDVLLGWAVGFGAGYAIPAVFRYRGERGAASSSTVFILPRADWSYAGLELVGAL